MSRKPQYLNMLPQQWNVLRVSEMLNNGILLGHLDGNHGGDYPRSEDFVSHGIPYISANCIVNGKIDHNLAKYLTPQHASRLRKGKAKNGDVLFAHNATVGPVALLETSEPLIVLSTTLTYYRCNEDALSNLYLKAFLESELFQRQYEPLMAQSTRNQIPITTQREFFIALPPLPEQRKIAEILSTWDAAIGLVNALIAALQARKKGLMQRLLTGEVRFPGFDGEWEEVQLGDVAKVIMGQSPPSEAYNSQGMGLPLIQGNADVQNRRTKPRTFTSIVTKLCQVGDIIMSVRAPVGEISRSLHEACIGRGVAAIRPTRSYDEFLYQLMIFTELAWQRLGQGSTFTAVNSTDIKKFHLSIPNSIDEQSTIAAVLNICDAEIEDHVTYLMHLREQKKGLMQSLLTGDVRVKVEEQTG